MKKGVLLAALGVLLSAGQAWSVSALNSDEDYASDQSSLSKIILAYRGAIYHALLAGPNFDNSRSRSGLVEAQPPRHAAPMRFSAPGVNFAAHAVAAVPAVSVKPSRAHQQAVLKTAIANFINRYTKNFSLARELAGTIITEARHFFGDSMEEIKNAATLAAAMLRGESHFNSREISHDKYGSPLAFGIAQIVPGDWLKSLQIRGIVRSAEDLFDPKIGIRSMMFILKANRDELRARLHQREVTDALVAGYNCGDGCAVHATDKNGNLMIHKLPQETRNYVPPIKRAQAALMQSVENAE